MINASINIDANVIRQLGEELVTDAEQALLELIKNSYDADAEWVRLTIDTAAGSGNGHASGVIRVEDNGQGMTLDQLQNGWLRISLSLKRQAKAAGERTAKGRTPLGDKGLGRLSTMKLGDVVDIQTYPSKRSGFGVRLRWSDFKPGTNLKDIRVSINEIPPIGRTGTQLSITNLRDVEYWKRRNSAANLQGVLSKLISPFKRVSDFRLSGDLDGTPLKPEFVASKLRDTATTHFSFNWAANGLRCKGRVKLSLFHSDEVAFEHFVLPDNGEELLQFLQGSKLGQSLQIHRAKAPWFIGFERSWDREEIDARTKPGQPPVADPGPFDGEIDGFDLETIGDRQSEVFSSLGEYRNFVKRLAGVSIYRDGFAIRAEHDWLGLGESWTSGRSYYGLKPANTVGYVGISAADNQGLIEKSDREGFIDNPAARGFADIVETFVGFANDSLTVLRRGFNNFRSAKKTRAARLEPDFHEADAVESLKRIGRAAAERSVSIKKSEHLRREAFLQLKSELQTASRLPSLDRGSRNSLMAAETRLSQAVAKWETVASDVVAVADDFQRQSKVGDAVVDRLEHLKNQNEELFDFVAIGLVAQALAHDVRMLLDDLLSRTKRIAGKTRTPQPDDFAAYVESVRATIHALRKQLTFLDPMQRATRETKQQIILSSFLEELLQFREEKYSRLHIDARCTTRDDFAVRFNRGRLLQIFDNLLRNSEYWLKQSGPDKPSIRIVVAEPIITLWDTGPGIKESLEDTLFEPFVTDKPRGYGSGLGLFIVSQLLKKEGCDIRLQSVRNERGRRYKFQIDLSGALSHDEDD
jgi:signal transduction histidine kinase